MTRSLCFLAAVRALLSAGSAWAAAPAPCQGQSGVLPNGAYVLPLQRKPLLLDDSEPKDFYVGTVRAGAEGRASQQLFVIFDTTSGQVLFPSSSCDDPACLQRNRYSPKDAGASFIGADGIPIAEGAPSATLGVSLNMLDIGDGEVDGIAVRDRICLGGKRANGQTDFCAKLGLLSATRMSGEAFEQTPFDGIIGLGLEALSADPDFSFTHRLSTAREGAAAKSRFTGQFALYIPATGDAEISFGGHNPARLASPLVWVPAKWPEMGFWQVSITKVSVRLANVTFSLCEGKGCRGVIDTGLSRLGVPPKLLPGLSEALALSNPGDGDCRSATGPNLLIQLEGKTLMLSPEDYAGRIGGECVPRLEPVDLEAALGASSIFVLGEPMLRRYYTVFDWDAMRIGFGLAAEPDDTCTALEGE